MIDHPILTRVGIFEYRRPDGSIRRELRLPEEVFAQESLASYKGKPVILTHEAGMIDSDNVQQEQIGTILSEGTQDGDNVRAQISIHDARKLDYGLRELSLGYSLDLEEVPGEWQGQPYDAIQRNIRVNHLALVEKARAGDSARLNDKLHLDGIDTMKPMDAKKAIIKKVNPNIRLDGKDKAYIDAMYDITKESIGKRKGVDYQRQQMRGDGMEKGVRKAPDAQSAAAKRAGMIARMDGTDKKEGGNK